MRRAEHYIAAHADRRLDEQTPVDVNAYLAELGRKPGLKAWQFRQAVDAIHSEPRTGPDRGLPEDLALVRKVSASTQNLALNALVFLYREVLRREDLVNRSAPRAAE